MSDETPAARWRERGEADPHGDRYNCERKNLIMGDRTDDEIANAVYLCNHRTSLDSMPLLTAAKDRIRWLSRALNAHIAERDAAIARAVAAEAQLEQAREATERRVAELEQRTQGLIRYGSAPALAATAAKEPQP